MKVFREFRVGRFTCEMTFDQSKGANALDCAWSPNVPTFGELTQPALDQYRAGRNALLKEVADKLGGKVLVVE